MGCAHVKPASLNATLDVLITQSHGLKDAAAVELAIWMQTICSQRGLTSFYQKGLCGSVKLEGKRRRLLRDLFESARCVAVAAVARASKFANDAPLANEVLWAEQHNKPVLLVYDSSTPLDLHFWESTWPPLFQPAPMVARYYGKGHEACADGLISQINRVLSGVNSSSTTVQPTENLDHTKEGQEDFDVSVSSDKWFAALKQLRAAQPNDLPEVQFRGILRRQEKSKAKGHKDPNNHLFPEEALQEAIRFVIKSLPGVRSEEALLELLCASVGVSERLVAASLRHLAARIPTGLGSEFLEEVQVWSMIALRRHSDSVDACTFSMQCLDSVFSTISQRTFSSAEVECLVSAIRNFPSCHALQRHGFSFLAQLLANHGTSQQSSDLKDAMFALPGGGLARIITRLGVAELALCALSTHGLDPEEDPVLLQNVCFLLQKLALGSREVKLSVLESRKLWVRELRKPRKPKGSTAVLSMLSSLIADDHESKVAAGAATDLLEALQGRCTEDALEVFAFLCCLTSKCLQTKRQCCAFGGSVFLQEAVKICLADSEISEATRLAAGGFLVNICSDPASLQSASSMGAADAAEALSSSGTGELARCGEVLRQLLESKKSGDGRRWKSGAEMEAEDPFSGLFAIRQNQAVTEQQLVEYERPPLNDENPNSKEVSRTKRERSERHRRGPGWQRLPSHAGGVHDPKIEPQEVDGFELGDWASSALARPLSGFQGLSKDLWMKRDGLEKAPAETDEEMAESVELSPRSLLEPKVVPPAASSDRPAIAQVSKGRTLRPQLEELRSKAQPPPVPRKGFWPWSRRSSRSEARHPGERAHDLWMARMAAPQAVEEGEIELDFRLPSQHSMGKAKSRRSEKAEPGVLGQGSLSQKALGTAASSSQIFHFTSQDFQD